MAPTRFEVKAAPTDIMIVGAGIAATALASLLLLGQSGHSRKTSFRITVLERSRAIQTVGQNIDIRGLGRDVLKRLGVDEQVRKATTGEEGAKFVDSKSQTWASFAADKSGEVETGTAEIEILRGRLAGILYDRCCNLSETTKKSGNPAVEFIFGDSLDEIKQENSRVHVRLRHGGWRSFHILIGADGLQSRTRSLAYADFGLETGNVIKPSATGISSSDNASLRRRGTSKESYEKDDEFDRSGDTDQSVNGCFKPLGVYAAFYSIPKTLLSGKGFNAPSPEDQTYSRPSRCDFDDDWRRWYHAPGRRSVMVRPSDDKSRLTVLMTVLDLDDQDARLRSAAIVKDDRRSAVAIQKKLMQEYFERAGWECVKLVEGMNASDDFYYDVVAQVKMEKWWNGRVCLLGDAAYCASPFSGMGTTLALVGAYNLAGALSKHTGSTEISQTTSDAAGVDGSFVLHNISQAFEEYQAATTSIVSKAQKLPPGMPWIIHPETGWGIWILHFIPWLILSLGLDKALAKLFGSGKTKSTKEGLVEWSAN